MTDKTPRILVMRVPGKEYVLAAYVTKPEYAASSIALYQSYLEMDRTKDKFLFRLDRCYAAGCWTFAQHNTLLGTIIFDSEHCAPCPLVMSDALALAKHAIHWWEKGFAEIISQYKHVTLAGVDGKLIAAPVYEHRGPDNDR